MLYTEGDSASPDPEPLLPRDLFWANQEKYQVTLKIQQK